MSDIIALIRWLHELWVDPVQAMIDFGLWAAAMVVIGVAFYWAITRD